VVAVASWYYISGQGQIGPIGEIQVRNLVEGNIITRQTLMWKPGMAEWLPAGSIPEVAAMFSHFTPPSPPPGTSAQAPFPSPAAPDAQNVRAGSYEPVEYSVPTGRSRVAAGVLNMFLPGAGRLYLGYFLIGFLQLVVTVVSVPLYYYIPCTCLPFCVPGHLWSFIDGLMMLAFNTVDNDARGVPLRD
jgi:TM2 domain-containing membrane protein YozV